MSPGSPNSSIAADRGTRQSQRLLAAVLLALLLSGCAQVDRRRFDSLHQAAAELRDRVVASHARVRRLQDAVFRGKVSLSPQLDENALARPGWLDTGAQFGTREEVLDAVAEFTEDLHAVAARVGTEQINLSARRLFSGSDAALQTARDLLATVPALRPSSPGLGDMVARLFPTVAAVGGVLTGPVLESSRRGDMLTLMQGASPLVRERLGSLLPGNEVLAEYTLALKTEYLGDASELRDRFSGADRYRFDQTMLDLLQEFDAAAADSASLSKLMQLMISAYEETVGELTAPQAAGASLRELLTQLRRAQTLRKAAP